ncbi:DMT family transporter [Alteromonas aestuariivivens]|uniref:DMT family transporter n=1 Tax=Alteromonas aestuariivivens TaxID=1938339 RepID=A0A3D8MAS8_9ALTE|nr:DMT family transporter [Alteromonas aestuariivivens]RDV26835.1 DMT family transporter [Alteromonas aestuariivivens]
MPIRDLGALLILGAIWGGSFLFMRVAAPEFGIYALVEVRTVLACLVLLPFLFAARAWPDFRNNWLAIALIGLVNTALPFSLFNYSSLHLEAGVNAILNGTAPMFGAVVAYLWLRDKLTRSAVVGLVIGFIGVALISQQKVGSGEVSFLPILTALLATACYGLAASMMKRYLQGVKPIAVATGSQLMASVVLAPVALATWPTVQPSSAAWLNAIALAVAGTGIAYILYFNLIANLGPAKAITVAYLVPLFGILWGLIFLGERLSLTAIFGGGLILLGVALTTGVVGRLRRNRPSAV